MLQELLNGQRINVKRWLLIDPSQRSTTGVDPSSARHIDEVTELTFKLEDARVAANNLSARLTALTQNQVSLEIPVTQHDGSIQVIP